ncbi:response regulator [bacterium]|nr:response regulator [bacterium]
MGTILGKEDYRIFTAVNGQRAIIAAEKILPDIILMDIMMPEMNGYEACHNAVVDTIGAFVPLSPIRVFFDMI